MVSDGIRITKTAPRDVPSFLGTVPVCADALRAPLDKRRLMMYNSNQSLALKREEC